MPREKRFTDTLGDIRNGDVVTDLTEALREVVTRVLETGKKGTLTLKLTVTNVSRGAGAALQIDDDITTKIPKPSKGASVLFADADGQLQRNDPRQPRLAEFDTPTVAQMPAREAVNQL